MSPEAQRPTALYSEVLDAAEVAALLRCSVKTVEEHARRGTLPGDKFGDAWVFPRAALIACLNERAVEAAAKRRREAERPAPLARAHPPAPGHTRPAPPTLPALSS